MFALNEVEFDLLYRFYDSEIEMLNEDLEEVKHIGCQMLDKDLFKEQINRINKKISDHKARQVELREFYMV